MALLNYLRGVVTAFLIICNAILVWIPLAWWILQRTWTRGEALQRLKVRMDNVILWWAGNNGRLFDLMRTSEVKVTWHDKDKMSPDKWYLVVSNHQSWTDIVLLQSHLHATIPPLKFFTKEQLIWLPFIGLAMKVLGFPYVKRATKDQIKANPSLRHADRDNTIAACEEFKNHPTSVLNFIEGTRNTPEKHARQRSEYRHLLRPKIGGLDYVLEGLEDHLDCVLDITIIYPDGVPTMWDYLQGKCRHVVFEVRPCEVPAGLQTDDVSTRRTTLARWIKSLWEAKDARITEVLDAAA